MMASDEGDSGDDLPDQNCSKMSPTTCANRIGTQIDLCLPDLHAEEEIMDLHVRKSTKSAELHNTQHARQSSPSSLRSPQCLFNPDGVEVIDLDMLETTNSRNVEISNSIKQEPLEDTFRTSGAKNVEEHPNTRKSISKSPTITAHPAASGTALTEDDSTENIKQEFEASEIEFVWTNLSKQVIDLVTDDEAEALPSVEANNAETTSISNRKSPSKPDSSESHPTIGATAAQSDGTIKNAAGPQLKKFLFTRPKKAKGPITAERRAKLELAQRLLAERATGKVVPGCAGTLFSATPKLAGSADSVQSRIGPDVHREVSTATRNESEILSDSDGDAEKKFSALKKKYNSKKKKRTNTIGDDVAFIRAEKIEAMRLKRLEKAEVLEALEDAQAAGLFVSEDEGYTHASEHPYANDIELGALNNLEEEDFLRQQKFNAEYRPNKRRRTEKPKASGRNPITAKLAEESMLEGANVRHKKDLQRAKRDARAKKTKAPNEEGTVKVSKRRKAKPKEVAGIEPATKSKKSRKTNGPVLTNLSSLTGRDVIADAQANVGKDVQPTFQDTRKDLALRELMASIPEENRRLHATDKTALNKATKKFNGVGAMKACDGGWKLKGMATSLYHYQLLGAAFMRDRENGQDRPLGGIQADEMGFGKTVMMIANILDGQPEFNDLVRTTLIVCTPALVPQWMREIDRHTEPNVLSDVLMYAAGSRLQTNDVVKALQKYQIVVTTYGEILRSYPKYLPPAELVTDKQRQDWWVGHFEKHKGPFHRILWQRVVLDEAQIIKNHESQTSIACRGLMSRFRWALSGTPIANEVEEFYSYFSFLKVKHTGSFQTFKKNFCGSDQISTDRLHSFLCTIMIRRTHLDSLFGRPVLLLPPSHQETTQVEFNEIERAIYQIVRSRFIQRINVFAASGTLQKNYSHIFHMMLILRMLTGHIFLIQGAVEDLLEEEDIEKLMQLTNSEAEEESEHKLTLVQLRKMLSGSRERGSPAVETVPNAESADNLEDIEGTGREFGAIFVSFKKYLRKLREGSKWNELHARSSCHACRSPPDHPWLTSCQHIYCEECLISMQYQAARNNEDHTKCRACGQVFTEAAPCKGLEELGFKDSSPSLLNESIRRRRPSKSPESTMRWIDLGGFLLPSAKTLAIKAQLLNWFEQSTSCKVIIFSQFLMMIRILARICDQEGWGYLLYHGKMNHAARDNAISVFEKDEEKRILLSSLRAGSLGLNLTMATRVINVDLWFNSTVEQQAYCRVFRLGQKQETYIQRFAVKNTIDDDLLKMQERKTELVSRALGDDGREPSVFSVEELLRLFGRVDEDEEGRPFIFAESEDEANPNLTANSGG